MMNPLCSTFMCLLLMSTVYAGGESALETAFRSELLALRTEIGFPGATAGFVLADGRFGDVAVGVADIALQRPMTTQSRMLAASIGKTYVSAAALALVADGLINLDDPISDWVGDRPWFARLPQAEKITVRHLLMHRSGLPDHVHTPRFQAALQQTWHQAAPFSADDLVGFVVDQPACSAPGTAWHYSDTGYIIGGLILEEACGQSLYQEIATRFLDPLALANTVPSNQRRLPGLVPGYTSPENAFGFPVKSLDCEGNMQWHPGVEGFGGGWLTTAGDLARWGQALYDGAALSDAARAALYRTEAISDAEEAPRYGLGVSHHTDGALGPTLGHGGWIPGYVSSLRYYPHYRMTVAFQINTDDVKSDGDWLKKMEQRLAEVLVRETTREKKVGQYE